MHSNTLRWAKPASRLLGADLGALGGGAVAIGATMIAHAITHRAVRQNDPLRARVMLEFARPIRMQVLLEMVDLVVPCCTWLPCLGGEFAVVWLAALGARLGLTGSPRPWNETRWSSWGRSALPHLFLQPLAAHRHRLSHS